MSLEQFAWLSSIVSAVALVTSVIYASIQIRQNTRAVLASAYQQVVDSFAQLSFEVGQDKNLAELYLRGGREFASLGDVERAQYGLLLLSFMRRAENVFFQTEIHMLQNEHWVGIRDSIKVVLQPAGARACWNEIRSRMNPKFAAFIDALISSSELAAGKGARGVTRALNPFARPAAPNAQLLVAKQQSARTVA